MRPYAHESVFRIKEFCNHVGVTDRYTGYRNNLNRGNRDPVVLAFSWLDNPTYKPHFTNIRVKSTSGTYNKDLCKAQREFQDQDIRFFTYLHILSVLWGWETV